MKSETNYIRFTQVVLVFVFMVILAGSIVRATQSGMGCPDWPTCFGNVIPPTEYSQVIFQPNHDYKKGQFIIHNDSLKYAKEKFTSTADYNPANWQQYEKHNYAKFEVYQTWIEYVNRLCTGLLGFLLLAHIIWSFRLYYKTRKSIVWLSASLILLVVFEAWLGKVVVDTNLGLLQITGHYLPALAMAAVPLIIIVKLQQKEKVQQQALAWLTVLGLLAVLAQIIIGTAVRAEVDTVAKLLNYQNRAAWINQLSSVFTLHQVSGIIVAVLCVVIFWLATKYAAIQKLAIGLLIVILLAVATGLIMANLHIPAVVQPMHLLLSSILFIVLLNLRLRVK